MFEWKIELVSGYAKLLQQLQQEFFPQERGKNNIIKKIGQFYP